jgi:hypothetical protein
MGEFIFSSPEVLITTISVQFGGSITGYCDTSSLRCRIPNKLINPLETGLFSTILQEATPRTRVITACASTTAPVLSLLSLMFHVSCSKLKTNVVIQVLEVL